MLQKPYINPGIVINNQSFHTAPIQKNFVKIPNMDSRINQNIIFDSNELNILYKKGFRYIPKEYFGQEIKEAAE